MKDLSVIITAKNEEFLSRTVEDVLKKKQGNTEVIVICDGNWPDPSIKDHEDLTIIYHKESIGQRAAINEAAKLSQARYIMKLDAHCIVSEGFDKVLIKDGDKLGKKVVQVPRMYNLHAFDWKCKKCGNRWYQGPTPKECQQPGEKRGINKDCDSKEFERVMVWKPRFNRKSDHYRFDKDLKFQYWGSLGNRPGNTSHITETMSLLGACFVWNRKRYWEIDGSDELHGSWGQQGTEIACMGWLSGGRVVTNKNCWFSHMFRTQGGDFGFPYELRGSDVHKAREHSQNKWTNGKWKHQKRDLDWLLEKFKPVPDWHDNNNDLTGEAGIIFYTDNQVRVKLAKKIQNNLLKASGNMPIVSISLKPMAFPYKHRGKNIHVKDKRGWSTMNKQILTGLKALKTKYVFFCEHDVLYSPTHFEFTPKKDDVYYYNTNVWRLREEDGFAVRVDFCQQLSGLVCNRELAIKHYEKRQKMVDEGIPVRRIGFEPGTHTRKERVDKFKSDKFESREPNVDVRRKECATASRWSPDQFRNKKFAKGWTESYEIPHWGKMADFL